MTPHVVLLPTIVVAIVLYVSAFKDGKPTCDNYIQNTYIYAIGYLFLLTYFVMWFAQYPTFLNKIDFINLMLVLLANVGLYFAILFIPSENYALKHVLSILYIASASFLLSVIFQFFGSDAVVFAAVITVIMFIVLSGLAFKFQSLISTRISLTLVIVFIVLLVAELLVGLYFPSSILEKVIILAVLMVVCYFVLVKTKRIIENSQDCDVPDYVKDSIGLILSFQNILLRILQLRRGR